MSHHLVGRSRPGGDSAARAGAMDRARRQYLLGTVVTGFVVLTVFLVFAPSQALLDRNQSQGLDVVGEFVPQGWAFFTKDPREPYVSLYQRHAQGWEQANSTTVAGDEHLFGLDRSARTESYEIGVITGAIAEEEWAACDEELIIRCLPESPEPDVSVDSYGEDLSFCGVLAVTRQEPVPWAWADLMEQMPGNYAVVDVKCHDFERGQSL